MFKKNEPKKSLKATVPGMISLSTLSSSSSEPEMGPTLAEGDTVSGVIETTGNEVSEVAGVSEVASPVVEKSVVAEVTGDLGAPAHTVMTQGSAVSSARPGIVPLVPASVPVLCMPGTHFDTTLNTCVWDVAPPRTKPAYGFYWAWNSAHKKWVQEFGGNGIRGPSLSAPSDLGTYTVRENDTVGSILNTLGLPPSSRESFLAANPQKESFMLGGLPTARLVVGEKLRIPFAKKPAQRSNQFLGIDLSPCQEGFTRDLDPTSDTFGDCIGEGMSQPPPPSCTGDNQHADGNGNCVCDDGFSMSPDGVCFSNTSGCPGDQKKNSKGVCACIDPNEIIGPDGTCFNPTFQNPPEGKKGVQCKKGQGLDQSGKCIDLSCPEGTRKVPDVNGDPTCVNADGSTPGCPNIGDDNQCYAACDANEKFDPKDQSCSCVAGFHRATPGGPCVKNTGTAITPVGPPKTVIKSKPPTGCKPGFMRAGPAQAAKFNLAPGDVAPCVPVPTASTGLSTGAKIAIAVAAAAAAGGIVYMATKKKPGGMSTSTSTASHPMAAKNMARR